MNLERAFNLIRQLQEALGGNRIVRGTVGSAGSVVQGFGWSVVRNGVGDYSVTFDTAFSDPPTVDVSPGATSAYYVVKHFGGSAPTPTGFRVLVFNPSTLANVDGDWQFVALG